MKRVLLSIVSLFVLVVAGISPMAVAAQSSTPTSGPQLNIVATHSILGDLVRNVGGNDIKLTVLVGPDGDTHTYEPKPQDSIALLKADVVFESDLGFETWLDPLYNASQSKATRVSVTRGVTPLGFAGEGKAANEQPLATPIANGAEPDPHFWQNVQNSIIAVGNIRDALVAADPAHAADYTANAAAYLSQLKDLDAYIVAQTATLPTDRRKLVTNHDAFGYFAYRYGFTLEGSAFASFTTEAEDPSARQIAALVEDIKSTGVPAIFPENIENASQLQQIANEAGVKLAPDLYSDALGKPGTPGDTYIKMMTYNIDTIVAALKG